MTGMALDGSVSNAPEEWAAVARLVESQPDAAELLQMLGMVVES